MLWLEKYKPREFNLMVGHNDIKNILEKYDLNSMPHLIIHGQQGSGKKTIALNFIHHLFGTISQPNLRNTQVSFGSKTIDVNFLESNEYIEISPADYNFQDKIIIQSIIKEMAQSRPVMSFFTNKKIPSIKVVIITSAEDLTQEAQAALRRTIEVYSECFRIILICSQISKIIEPIRSRCVFVRVKGYEDNEIKEHLKIISETEEFVLNDDETKEIIKSACGNMRKAVCLLELLQFKKNDDTSKRQKIDVSRIKVEWEVLLDEIVASIRRSQRSETMIEVRKKLFILINSCIPAKLILMELYKRFISKESEIIVGKIVDLALIYEERLKLGTKGIYHLEAFIIGCMCVFNKTM
ncbi:replication factor C subunit 5 (RFC5) [Vairimorpha necatrix]|uniref:Replication factor C subunit 5 (RFC5) n=1 Tax=Vairimorpha necatrix TaxID=6039 RepID=A0AAX4JEB1_9MICR